MGYARLRDKQGAAGGLTAGYSTDGYGRARDEEYAMQMRRLTAAKRRRGWPRYGNARAGGKECQAVSLVGVLG